MNLNNKRELRDFKICMVTAIVGMFLGVVLPKELLFIGTSLLGVAIGISAVHALDEQNDGK